MCCVAAEGASLYGKVIQVNSGDVITITNLNRPVRVKLLGVDAPELDQAFGDVAKKHLSDLVFDKGVLVYYAGIAADKSLTGRVLLNDADIGAQMIRDGAAWCDLQNIDRLAASEREVYQQSEQAARSERRGLWQAENPTAPWEFVKAEQLKKYAPVSAHPNAPSPVVKHSNPASELTNFSLMTANVKAAAPSPLLSRPSGHKLETLGNELPANLPFIASPPRNGEYVSNSMNFGSTPVQSYAYLALEGRNAYTLTWFTAPADSEDDRSLMDRLILNDLNAIVAGVLMKDTETQTRCSSQSEKDVSANGYWGLELDLSQCRIPTRLRIFTKVTDKGREVYVGMVAFNDEDANVTRFIKTFTMRAKKVQKK